MRSGLQFHVEHKCTLTFGFYVDSFTLTFAISLLDLRLQIEGAATHHRWLVPGFMSDTAVFRTRILLVRTESPNIQATPQEIRPEGSYLVGGYFRTWPYPSAGYAAAVACTVKTCGHLPATRETHPSKIRACSGRIPAVPDS